MLQRLGNKKMYPFLKSDLTLCISSALFLIGLDRHELDKRHSVASRSSSVAFLKLGALLQLDNFPLNIKVLSSFTLPHE